MAEKKEKKLLETKNFFKIRAIVTGKDEPVKNNGFKSGVVEKDGKSKGKKYKSIKFVAKTSEDNIVPVEVFGIEDDFVYFYSKNEKKTLKTEWKYKTAKMPDGYELIIPKFDKAQKIEDTFKDGDLVVIKGNIEYSQYEDKEGNKKLQTKFNINEIYPSKKEVNFEDENFEEMNEFTQELVVIDFDTDEGRLYLNAYHINFNETFVPVRFEINTENSQFVSKIKSLKFGDVIKVSGIINNRLIESTEEVKSDDNYWGQKPSTVVKSYRKSLEITGADGDSLQQKKYKEKDFVILEKKIELPALTEVKNNDDGQVPQVPFLYV